MLKMKLALGCRAVSVMGNDKRNGFYNCQVYKSRFQGCVDDGGLWCIFWMRDGWGDIAKKRRRLAV